MSNRICIPAESNWKVIPNKQGIVRITPEAFAALADSMNAHGRTNVRLTVSELILQAVNNGLIDYEEKQNE